jgi:stage V sporulation protein G
VDHRTVLCFGDNLGALPPCVLGSSQNHQRREVGSRFLRSCSQAGIGQPAFIHPMRRRHLRRARWGIGTSARGPASYVGVSPIGCCHDNLAQSEEPDQPSSSSTVSITVLSVTPARGKKLFAFASVEIDIDGVQIGVHGIRATHEPGGTAIELPKFRDAAGIWRTAITLPEEVRSPIAKAVFDELVERGLAVRRSQR